MNAQLAPSADPDVGTGAVSTGGSALREQELAAIRRRLRRLGGQVAGIEKMLADGRGCGELLIQVSAAEGALRAVGQQIFTCHVNATMAAVGVHTVAAPAAAADLARLAGLLTPTAPPLENPAASSSQDPHLGRTPSS